MKARKRADCSAKRKVLEGAAMLCRRCGARERPGYHDWCRECHRDWRREREAAKRTADPERRAWVRDWNRLRMRAYRGHEMQEEACRVCQGAKGTLMLLRRSPLKWTILCRVCRERHFPGRDVTGRQTAKPPRTEQRILQKQLRAAVREIGL